MKLDMLKFRQARTLLKFNTKLLQQICLDLTIKTQTQ